MTEDLATRFPKWAIWRSDGGDWYATRRNQLSSAALNAGLVMTAVAKDPGSLNDVLIEQEQLAEKAN